MIYTPSTTGKQFHLARDVDSAFVRGIMGPIGSGKSVTCVLELLMIAMEQEPDSKGVRRTKFAIIRNTYRELLDTTVETFFTWINKSTGHWSALNMTFKLNQRLNDGTTMEAIFLFRALDKPDDVKKLLSLELTAAWINEAREIPKAVVDMVQGRVGRYPPPVMGVPPTFFGVILDTNPPDSDHWWYNMAEEQKSDNNFKFFRQPSGTSAVAENIVNLPRNYYKNMSTGKSSEWIKVYIHGEYGFISDGRPVWPEYNDSLHYTDKQFMPDITRTVYVGIDFGLTPSAVFGQTTSTGAFIIFDELVTFNMGAVNFGKLLKQHINEHYKQCIFEIYGDPAGDSRAQTDEQTPFMILYEQGINAFPTYTNDFSIRREVVASYMQRLDFTGQPAFQITSGAPNFRKACAGGYKYNRMQVSGDERFKDVPDKNKFSHVADAGQYLMLSAVGASSVVGGYSNKQLDYGDSYRMYR